MKAFLKIIKELNANTYINSLQVAMNIENRKVVLFYPHLDNNELNLFKNYLNKIGIGIDFICLLKENIDKIDTDLNSQIILVENILELAKKNNVVIFMKNEDVISWKFQEKFFEMGIRFILPIGDLQVYNNIHKYIINNIDNIYDTYYMLNANDDSRASYVASLYNKVSGNINELKFSESQQYFLAGYLPKQGDIVIDGGSYDGSNARDFSQLGCKVYSFELDKNNYEKVLKSANQYHFIPENKGLGAVKDDLHYSVGGVGSRVAEAGENIAEIIDIDTYVLEKEISKIDFIKMDIEGSELDALKGARNSICKWKPKMAICMYHKIDDMWKIPQYIKSLRSDYEFSFRHYPIDARFEYIFNEEQVRLFKRYNIKADYVKTPWETVLYCK